MADPPRLVFDSSVHPFEGLDAVLVRVDGLRVAPADPNLESMKNATVERLRAMHRLESLKDVPELRAYRDFFWRVGIDPTKVRPAAEALLRRILQGKPMPTINTLVDAYNLGSLETRIAFAAFDAARLHGDVQFRMAREGEPFLGIAMGAPIALTGREVVNADDGGLIAVYPYRDAQRTAVTLSTTSVALMACGVPGIPREALQRAADVTRAWVERFCRAA